MKDIELLSLLETNARLSVRDLSDILLEEEENIIAGFPRLPFTFLLHQTL